MPDAQVTCFGCPWTRCAESIGLIPLYCALRHVGTTRIWAKSHVLYFSNCSQCWYLQRIGLPKRKKSRTVCSA